MTAIDLFCGCGGLSLGLVRSGIDVVLGVDHWSAALQVYRRNLTHPVRGLDLAAGIPDLPPVDLIAGGPPCQDFSQSGKRAEGDRAALTATFAGVVLASRPTFFVIENVPQAAGSRAYAAATNMLRPHYGMTEVVMDCEYHGVPQARRRLVVVGRRGGRDGEFRDALMAGRSDRPLTVREAIGSRLAVRHYYFHPRQPGRRAIRGLDEPAPTITGRSRPIPPGYQPHPRDATADLSGVRALTLREAAAVQTFPPGWDWAGVRLRDAWQMLGNAVPPALGEHVGRVILAADAGPCRAARDMADGVVASPDGVQLLHRDNRAIDWPELDLVSTGTTRPFTRARARYEILQRGDSRCFTPRAVHPATERTSLYR